MLEIVVEFGYHLKRDADKKSDFGKEKFEKDERKYLKSNSTDENYRFYICIVKEEFIGFAFFGKQDDNKTKGFVGELYVKPKHRGKGIATKLLHEAKEWINEQNVLKLK